MNCLQENNFLVCTLWIMPHHAMFVSLSHEINEKWQLVLLFCPVVLPVRWVIHPLWKALYDIITHIFATKRNMWHIQKPASRMYSTVLQSNSYILEVLRCHSINLMRVSCNFGRPSNVEIGWNIKWFCCCCFLTVTKFCTFKLFWSFLSFELRHPLYLGCSWKLKRK